jgi:hypothetical protein
MKYIYILLLILILYYLFSNIYQKYSNQENFDPSLVPVSSIVTLAKVAQKLVDGGGTLTNPGNLQIGMPSAGALGNLRVTGTNIVDGVSTLNGDTTINNSVHITGATTTPADSGDMRTHFNHPDGYNYLRGHTRTDGNVDIRKGNLSTSGNISINNTTNLNADGTGGLNIQHADNSTWSNTTLGSLTANGNAQINGNSGVSGSSTIGGQLTVNGSASTNVGFPGTGGGQNLNSYISTPSLHLGRGWNNGDIIHSNAPSGLSLTADNGVGTLGNFSVDGDLNVGSGNKICIGSTCIYEEQLQVLNGTRAMAIHSKSRTGYLENNGNAIFTNMGDDENSRDSHYVYNGKGWGENFWQTFQLVTLPYRQ